MITTNTVTHREFALAYARARELNPTIRDMTTPANKLPKDATYFLTPDRNSGYIITTDGTLCALFSNVRGRGDQLLNDAIADGAMRLNHYATDHLSNLYERHGFREVRREANWTPGRPDVVWREL